MKNAHTLAATIGDREGVLAPKLERLVPDVVRIFDGVAVKGTTVTNPRVISLLDTAHVAVEVSEPNTNLIGCHRRESVRMALDLTDSPRVVYMDLDHCLRWIESDVAELERVLEEAEAFECTVIGRGPRSFAALPERLASTESIVNRVYELMTGRGWDLMMAARSLSRDAARSIAEGCHVDTIGNDVAWPLHCEAQGLSVGYIEAEGLTYRTNVDYAHDLADGRDGDPRAWATRVLLAAQHVEAMLPYMQG